MIAKRKGEAGGVRPPLVLLAAVLLGVGAGCGGGEKESATITEAPACAKAGEAIDRPAGVPADLLPAGTVLTSSEHSSGGRIAVVGVIPREFREAVEFFVEELPAAGYRNGEGDSEQDEAEARFSGKGVTGKWKVNGILNCPQAVILRLVVSR